MWTVTHGSHRIHFMNHRCLALFLPVFFISLAVAEAQDAPKSKSSASSTPNPTPCVSTNASWKDFPIVRWWRGDLLDEAYKNSKAYFNELNSSISTIDDWSGRLQNYWSESGVTGNWFGIGKTMKDYGLTISGVAKETYIGQVTPSALPQKYSKTGYSAGPLSNWLNEEKFNFIYDFGKIFDLSGLTAESDWRYRTMDGSQTDYYTRNAAGTMGNSSMFDPQKDNSGMGPRLMGQYLQWQTDMTADPRFMLKGGWMNPYEDFLSQPESKFYQNNAIAAAKGIGGGIKYYQAGKTYSGQGVPWTSTYDTWGGEFRVKPSSETYLRTFAGLSIAGEGGVASTPQNVSGYNNHGMNFQGTAKFDPNSSNYGQTGVYQMNELGWIPKLGDAKLDGHYSIGSYIWGQNNGDWGSHSGNATIWGLYLQGDQRLTAVRESAPSVPSISRNPDTSTPTYSKTRGLYLFSELTYTPADACAIPFYYQIGLNYHGLFNARPTDVCGVAVGEGFYSQNMNDSLPKNQGGAANSYASQYFSTTCVWEVFYNFQINKWMACSPYAEYIINPAGNGSCVNAAVLGAQIGVKF